MIHDMLQTIGPMVITFVMACFVGHPVTAVAGGPADIDVEVEENQAGDQEGVRIEIHIDEEKLAEMAESVEAVAEKIAMAAESQAERLAMQLEALGARLETGIEQFSGGWDEFAEDYEVELEQWGERYARRWEEWADRLREAEGPEDVKHVLEGNMEMISELPILELYDQLVKSAQQVEDIPWEQMKGVEKQVRDAIRQSLAAAKESRKASKAEVTDRDSDSTHAPAQQDEEHEERIEVEVEAEFDVDVDAARDEWRSRKRQWHDRIAALQQEEIAIRKRLTAIEDELRRFQAEKHAEMERVMHQLHESVVQRQELTRAMAEEESAKARQRAEQIRRSEMNRRGDAARRRAERAAEQHVTRRGGDSVPRAGSGSAAVSRAEFESLRDEIGMLRREVKSLLRARDQ